MGTQSLYQVSLPGSGEPPWSVDLPSVGPFSLPPPDTSPGVTQHIRKIARGLRKRRKSVLIQGERHRDGTRIDVLPDDVLLEIFCIYRLEELRDCEPLWVVWKWHLLVHVCRRWRQVVFASPLRLDLRILCIPGTSVRQNLCIWPCLPIVLIYHADEPGSGLAPDDEDNVIAALEYPDLVSYLSLEVTGSQLRKIATVMQQPFPELTSLFLNFASLYWNESVLPDGFLGGSAPRLQEIELWEIPFPALPTLLLSTSGLTSLALRAIPPAGYISPEAIVVGLAALPRLESLIIEFSFATPHPDRIHPPPATRTVIPTLTDFHFEGASTYLEDLVGRIDSPQLEMLEITYWNQLVDFQVTQLSNFVHRSVASMVPPFRHAQVNFLNGLVSFKVENHTNHPAGEWCLTSTGIRCEGIDWQVFHITHVLSQFLATLSTIQHLELKTEPMGPPLDGMDDTEWPHLLQQFSAVKTLHVSQGLAAHVAFALENITGGMFAEALPSLELIHLAGQPASSIESFVTFRHLSGRPVTVIGTQAEFEERLKSYVRESREDEYAPE